MADNAAAVRKNNDAVFCHHIVFLSLFLLIKLVMTLGRTFKFKYSKIIMGSVIRG